MKTRFLAIAALAVLASCSKSDPLPEAIKIWNADEMVQRFQDEQLGSAANEYAYVDIDADGTQELLLRQHIEEEWGEGTGFMAVFTNGKSGLKLVGLSHNMAQTGGITVSKNGVVKVSDGNESGTKGEVNSYVLKNSEIAAVYSDVYEYVEPEEDAEYDENWVYDRESYFVSEPAGSQRKEITAAEFEKALAGADDEYYSSDFNWQKIEVK
ncbi:MAG: hypothetical protein J6Y82_01650 [Bacteroidales bacterium]|nr:hypothetical protein [Bacteroidales bacterium]